VRSLRSDFLQRHYKRHAESRRAQQDGSEVQVLYVASTKSLLPRRLAPASLLTAALSRPLLFLQALQCGVILVLSNTGK
jgi:hypothetical protein